MVQRMCHKVVNRARAAVILWSIRTSNGNWRFRCEPSQYRAKEERETTEVTRSEYFATQTNPPTFFRKASCHFIEQEQRSDWPKSSCFASESDNSANMQAFRMFFSCQSFPIQWLDSFFCGCPDWWERKTSATKVGYRVHHVPHSLVCQQLFIWT